MFDDSEVTFDVIFVAEGPKAVLVDIDGTEVWIPNSQIKEDSEVYVGCDMAKGDEGVLVCSEWIAKKKELL